MEPPKATLDLFSTLRRRGLATSLLAAREWRTIDPTGDWSAQWAQRVPRVDAVLSAARVGAATLGADSVPQALAESGFPEPQDYAVNPNVFAGWSGHGVRNADYLSTPVIVARRTRGSAEEMLAAGGKWLDGLIRTAVADAGRSASGLAIAATKNAGYLRYEPEPYCQRCAVLVGKWFKWNTGFRRHPRCDAIHVPQSERAPEDARYSASFDPTKVHDLTAAQRDAIADGADPYRVINAYRKGRVGHYESMATTTEMARGAVRMTPEAIYSLAKGDQRRAQQLLRKYRYLV